MRVGGMGWGGESRVGRVDKHRIGWNGSATWTTGMGTQMVLVLQHRLVVWRVVLCHVMSD